MRGTGTASECGASCSVKRDAEVEELSSPSSRMMNQVVPTAPWTMITAATAATTTHTTFEVPDFPGCPCCHG